MMRLPELYMGPRPLCKIHDLPLVRRLVPNTMEQTALRHASPVMQDYFEWVCPDERHDKFLDTWETYTLGVDWPRKKRRMPES